MTIHPYRFTIALCLAGTLVGCRDDQAVPPPHDSSFPDGMDTTAGTEPPPNLDGGSDDGEPEAPEAELCDAGDQAWVHRAITFIQGRRPQSIREVRLLAQAIEQLDEAGLDGRRLVALALAQGPLYRERWHDFFYDQLRVHRRGDQRNPLCYGVATDAADDTTLATWIRDNPAEAPTSWPQDVTMYDVVRSSLRLDDISPAYSANLFARMGTPITGGNVTRAEIEATNRSSYGKSFESQYLGRITECLGCHATHDAVTNAFGEFDHHWPVYEDAHFELAVYGPFDDNNVLAEPEVHAIFRHAGFVDYSWCDDDSPDCNVDDAVGLPAWGLDFNCGLFDPNAAVDPLADLGDVPYMAGPFANGEAATLFDLEPRFRRGLEVLADQGVEAGNDGALQDPTVGLAFLFALNVSGEVWKEAMGYPLVVANRFPRNQAQRDILGALAESFWSSHYSPRTLITDVTLHPYFNQSPPDRCEASTPYHLAAVFDPFTKEADDPQQRGNGVGDMVHRHGARVLLGSTLRALWWPLPEDFGGPATPNYAFLVPYVTENIANPPRISVDVGYRNPHYVRADGPYSANLCGAGFEEPCVDAPTNVELLRDIGVFINDSEGGFNGLDFAGLLHWEEELADGFDPVLGGTCTGPTAPACPPADFIDTLVAEAVADSSWLMWDLAVALKDRLITDPRLDDPDEIALMERLMEVSLDDTVAEVGAPEAVAAARRLTGALLNTPQFMLDGVTPPPVDASDDPTIIVPGIETQRLCQDFVALAAESSAWDTLQATCDGETLSVSAD
ncbi:MAG: hypothetical protein AAF799_30245 [Myxococcota bacterium]